MRHHFSFTSVRRLSFLALKALKRLLFLIILFLAVRRRSLTAGTTVGSFVGIGTLAILSMPTFSMPTF
ncbi:MULTISPECIES: hypothetical protein [unclassified Bradyrhizobium]|uniref:hypothetical protein n=1 Tax=unclassified Bradyrhizobium TaxID=2631580 RepID=UPI0012EC5375|nr:MULTISPECIES: hypothetical protein [unclassified Bradyrhizobium]MCP3462039.1 hypothetical protein [Bradyrhizobium sp. CCGUVB23]